MAGIKTVLLTGGAGYVGSNLVPRLLGSGFDVRVLDLYLFGQDVLAGVAGHPGLTEIKGDIRDKDIVDRAMKGSDAVIHLACISNDPSFELDPQLGKSINYDCFPHLVSSAKKHGVRRFIYASSSSVYGVKEETNVTEDLALEPLTDYSKYKALCEEILLAERKPGFVPLVLRPATVCGYSPRLRLDLTVNILTNLAFNKRRITVFGGAQMRPNIHIDDMCDLYVKTLQYTDQLIDGKIFNAGYENHTVSDIAGMVKGIVGDDVAVSVEPTNDNRSYHVSSAKMKRELGYIPRRTIENAITDLVEAFSGGRVPNSDTEARYYNIKTMQSLNMK